MCFPQEEIPNIHNEIIKLFSDPLFESYRQEVQKESFRFWSLINDQEYKHLKKLALIAYTSPTTQLLSRHFQS